MMRAEADAIPLTGITGEGGLATIERAEAARKLALQIAQQKAQQAQMMNAIFG